MNNQVWLLDGKECSVDMSSITRGWTPLGNLEYLLYQNDLATGGMYSSGAVMTDEEINLGTDANGYIRAFCEDRSILFRSDYSYVVTKGDRAQIILVIQSDVNIYDLGCKIPSGQEIPLTEDYYGIILYCNANEFEVFSGGSNDQVSTQG